LDELIVTDPATDFARLEVSLSLRPRLVVDGLFGIGLNRPLNPDWVRCIERINQARLRVLAVDVPSGLNAETGRPEGAAVEAAVTLTVGAPKTGMLFESAWPYVGRLEVAAEVGLSRAFHQSELQWTLPADFDAFPPRRAEATHKGTYGHLAIIAGSLGYHGAAVLTARGAQRAQPGLITLFTLGTVYPVIASQMQAVMVSPWQTGTDLSGPWTAFLIGPGLAAPDVPDELKTLVQALWRESSHPLIVDASALAWLPPGPIPKDALRVITPHPGEAARLLGTTSQGVQANRLDALRRLSARFGDCWAILKGHQTLVGRSSGPFYVNPAGNPYLAQGGSGDVLSGYLAGLLTQPGLRADPLRAIRYAVWQHGAAADSLQTTRQNWVVEDLVTELGRAQPI
jgi:NAD(P)H-hydrate epimerase